MDLEVMNSQHSPFIVDYYGSAIVKVISNCYNHIHRFL